MEISLTGAAILFAFLAVVVWQSFGRSMTGTELRRRLKALEDRQHWTGHHGLAAAGVRRYRRKQ